MVKQSSSQEEKKPGDYFWEVKAAQKKAKLTTQDIPGLRADLLPGSQVTPAQKTGIQKVNIRLVIDILMGFAILGLLWYALAGPGRSPLEQKLASLRPLEPTIVQQVIPSPLSAVDILQEPSITPSLTRTIHPTSTKVMFHTPTSTHIRVSPTPTPTITPTATPECWDAAKITLEDVGKTLCVQGVVTELIPKPDNFTVFFSQEKGAFYWVTYDMIWSRAKLRTCYHLEGVIKQIGKNPIQIFDYSNIPEECP